MNPRGTGCKNLETDSASPTVGGANPGPSHGKKETVKGKPSRLQDMITIGSDEYDLLNATVRRQEGTIVQLRRVYEAVVNEKEHELQLANEKAHKMELALTGMEKQFTNMVKLQTSELGTCKSECGMTSVRCSQTDSTCSGKSEGSENLPPTSLPVKLVECEPLATMLDSNIPKADPQTSHSSEAKTLFHPGTPCAAFDKVVQENLRLKKLCKELTSSNGTNKTISLDNQEYDEIITKLKQEVTQVKLELHDTRISLIMKDNGNKDALAVKLVELQKEKAKLSKSVVAKAYLLTIYNKEYERLKQAHIQLQQQVSQKNKVNTDTGTSAERQPGDGVETPDDTLRPEVHEQLTVLQARHTQEIERLQKEKQSLLQKNVKLQLLNKIYAESIEELSRTRRTVDEQPMSMADMRKEMDTLRDDNDMYAHEIKRYSKKMDEMELEMKATEKTKDTERLKQKEFCDKQVTQLQEQYTKLSKENLELQRKLGDVAQHNRQLQYQLSRSPQTSTESQNSPSPMTVPFVGEELVVADGVEEEKFFCPWCDRKFHDQAKLEVHKKKCMDS